MKIVLSKIILVLMMFVAIGAKAQSNTGAQPDMATLSQSGYVMGPGSAVYPVHASWSNLNKFMSKVDAFDSIVNRVLEVVCSSEQNKSVLLVGEPSLAYKYIFARIAAIAPTKCPADMWHVDVNISKIESGHSYVGEVDEYWNTKILAPSDIKNVILYFQSVGGLIGIGSHSKDDTGIEREYVANFTGGRMRTIGFIDKYEYNDTIRAKNAYVLEAFAEKILIPSLDAEQAKSLVNQYVAILYPHLTLEPRELNYLAQVTEYYQPNRQEPDRSLSVVNQLVRAYSKSSDKIEKVNSDITTPVPYTNALKLEWVVEKDSYNLIQLNFTDFQTEANHDTLKIYDANTNVLLDTFSGSLGAFSTKYYSAKKLKLIFNSDASTTGNGFAVNSVSYKSTNFEPHIFSHEEVRWAVMTVAQVPEWLILRDYSVIKDLPNKLNADVVGVAEGKKDLVRLAKNGYVAGRTDDKPIGTILFPGPTGTGKSYIAKKMAEFMGMRLVTLDMTSYKDASSFADFQEIMARALTNTPYAMFLFEEIDKASIEVLDQLYFMMDEGIFYDKFQRPLFARGAFIMMTTNAGSDTILNNKDNPKLREMLMADLGKSFRASFLNRFDAISIFKPFTDAEYRQLAQTMVNKKASKIKEFYSWKLNADSTVVDYITQYGKSPVFGARPMERLVESTIGIGIAEYQLEFGAIEPEATIGVTKTNLDPHSFKITVNGNSLDYIVSTTDSRSSIADSNPKTKNVIRVNQIRNKKIKKFFETIRNY